jgi:hypothetical protein
MIAMDKAKLTITVLAIATVPDAAEPGLPDNSRISPFVEIRKGLFKPLALAIAFTALAGFCD